MENIVFTQLSITEVRKLFREELEGYFTENPTTASTPAQNESDSLLTIKEAAALLHLSVPTIYGKVHAGEIPHSKKGKRLYFSKADLLEWVKNGRRKTVAETAKEADEHLAAKRR